MRIRYLNTSIYNCPLNQANLREGVYIYGSFEERSGHFDPDDEKMAHIKFIKIAEDVSNNVLKINDEEAIPYNNMGKLQDFVKTYPGKKIYLDITGLTHGFWAPILKLFLVQKNDLSLIYVEPREYTKSKNPVIGSFYDLSERIDGISPLPGLSTFSEDNEDFIFIPILGFEGQRYLHLLENVQPLPNRTFPIIGVPGYKAEYPFYTYHGNRLPLMDNKSWKNVRYASASCPYESFDVISEIATDYPDLPIKIALLGTKPHALGAILYRLMNPGKTELVYDHPIRLQKRTTGATIKHIYHVSEFFFADFTAAELQSFNNLR